MRWDYSDVGNVIIYRGESGLDEKIAIYNINPKVINTIGFVEYPLNGKILFGHIGIIKDNQKQNGSFLKNPGDWYLVGRVSGEELKILDGLKDKIKKIVDKEDADFEVNTDSKLDNSFLEHLLVTSMKE